jgi:hypothetical protein
LETIGTAQGECIERFAGKKEGKMPLDAAAIPLGQFMLG